jgi:riboflavin biosynthesis pyrimidine reductase
MIQRLFPASNNNTGIPLAGLYLGLNLHRQEGKDGLLIYSNYVASMDGRISSYNPETDDYEVPKALANERDWRLYQELAAQSDILITSARYFRQLSARTAQDMLPVGKRFEDLRAWRIEQGLAPQPAVAILSRSLDVPVGAIDMLKDRDIYLFTSEHAPLDKKEMLEAQGLKVVIAGKTGVEGDRLRVELIRCGFKSAYMIAGPEVHRTLIEAGALDQLFLSTRFVLMGSKKSHSFCEGELSVPHNMQLNALYLDGEGEQLFSQYVLEKS